jgi:hypothetical protein
VPAADDDIGFAQGEGGFFWKKLAFRTLYFP